MQVSLNVLVCQMPMPIFQARCAQNGSPKKAAFDRQTVRDAGLSIGLTARRSFVLNARNLMERDDQDPESSALITKNDLSMELTIEDIIELLRRIPFLE